MAHRIITINRMYGSGGRLLGKALAEELGIHFYDQERYYDRGAGFKSITLHKAGQPQC